MIPEPSLEEFQALCVELVNKIADAIRRGAGRGIGWPALTPSAWRWRPYRAPTAALP